MGFKDRKSLDDLPETVMIPVETLLRYYRKGIPISEQQKQQLREAGYMLHEIKNANQMAQEYALKYKSFSSTWNEAVREGWELDLWRYLMAVAYVQAQIICGEKNIGWSGTDIFGSGNPISDEMRRQFVKAQEHQAQTGQIDVAIPTGRMNEWKRSAETRKQKSLAERVA